MKATDGTEPPLLSIRGIRKAFGAVSALNGVDLEVRRPEVLALLGDNGAGKSTPHQGRLGRHYPRLRRNLG